MTTLQRARGLLNCGLRYSPIYRNYLANPTHQTTSYNVISRNYAKRKDTVSPDEEIIKLSSEKGKHPEKEQYQGEHNIERRKGKIFDKKPFKMMLESEKRYSWCACGQSKNQPLCDGSHRKVDGPTFMKSRPRFEPVRFTVPESKEYWLCNCKQSSKAPFCDGTHKRSDIQEAIKS